MKSNRSLLVLAFLSVLMFGTSLYAQQDVDPTWHNPWSAPTKAATPSKPQAAKPKMDSRVARRRVSKTDAKQMAARQTRTQIAQATLPAVTK